MEPDEELLKRAIGTFARAPHSSKQGVRSLRSVIGDVFGCGSTTASELCRRFGYDPEQVVRNKPWFVRKS